MRIPVTIRVYIGFIFLFLLSAGIGGMSYITIRRQAHISNTLKQVYQIKEIANEARYTVRGMESQRRAYRSILDPFYLDQYYQMQRQLVSVLANLRKLALEGNGIEPNTALLEKQINDLVLFWGKLRIDEAKYDSKANIAITHEEDIRLIAIDALIKTIVDKENERQIQSRQLKQENYVFLSWWLPCGTFLIQLFILALIILVLDELKKRKKAEAGLKQIIEKEKQLNEMKSRFITMASHEFRTPLAAIEGSAFLAAKYTTVDEQPKRQKHYDRITKAVRNLNEILEDMLTVDKLELGTIDLSPRHFSMKELIEPIIIEMQAIAKPGQKISYDHLGVMEVHLDPNLIVQIIRNLVSNAIKFSGEDGSITINTSFVGKQVRILVKDNGMGIPQNEIGHLFDRFHRGASVQNIEGTGLGLHIVYRYTRLMDGNIKCRSEVGVGTEFNLVFPQ